MATSIAVHQGWLAPAGAGVLAGEAGATRALFPLSVDDEALIAGMATLTRREREVLRGRAVGLTIGEIADLCFISPSSVKNHLCNAYAKLGLVDVQEKSCRACFLLGRYAAVMRDGAARA